jgi:hypothetical protein
MLLPTFCMAEVRVSGSHPSNQKTARRQRQRREGECFRERRPGTNKPSACRVHGELFRETLHSDAAADGTATQPTARSVVSLYGNTATCSQPVIVDANGATR